MPRSRIFRRDADCSDTEPESGSAVTVISVDRRETQSPVSALGGDGGSGSPDSTAMAVAPCPRGLRCHIPTVSFCPRRCPVCFDAKLFMNQSAFQTHLRKWHRQFLSNCGYCAPVPPVERRGSGGGMPRAAHQVESRSLLPRIVQPLLSLAVTMLPQPTAAPRPLLPPKETATLLRPTVWPLLSPAESAVPRRPTVRQLMTPAETVPPRLTTAQAAPRPLLSTAVEAPLQRAAVQLAPALPVPPRSSILANIGILSPPQAVARIEALPLFPGPRPLLSIPPSTKW